jgi:hypothetical protein
MGGHLMGGHFIGVPLMGVHLMGVRLIGMCLGGFQIFQFGFLGKVPYTLRTHARQGSRALISCSPVAVMPCEAQELMSGSLWRGNSQILAI